MLGRSHMPKKQSDEGGIRKQVEAMIRKNKTPTLLEALKKSLKKSSWRIGLPILFVALGFLFLVNELYGPVFFGEKSLELQRSFEVELGAPVISTPLLIDEGKDKKIYVADTMGSLVAYHFPLMDEHFRYQYKSPVITPLSHLDADGEGSDEVLLFTNDGGMSVMGGDGKYLYEKREESLFSQVVSKPLVYAERGEMRIALVDREGMMGVFEGRYGRFLWQRRLEGVTDVVSAVGIYREREKNYGLVLGREGNFFVVNLENGGILWSLHLEGAFYASVVPLSLKRVAVVSKKGEVYILDMKKQEVALRYALNSEVVATPALVDHPDGEELVIATLGGEVAVLSVKEDGLEKKTLMKTDAGFRASPVLFDFNSDGRQDVVLVSFMGDLWVIDGKSQKPLFEALSLSSEVTATPLVIPLSRAIYIVIATEKNKLVGLVVRSHKKRRLSQGYLEFLRTQDNQG